MYLVLACSALLKHNELNTATYTIEVKQKLLSVVVEMAEELGSMMGSSYPLKLCEIALERSKDKYVFSIYVVLVSNFQFMLY